MGEGYLGEFEQMVLLTVLQLEDGAYGVSIMDDLDRRVGRRVSRGAMYVTLDRLEDKGFLEGRVAEPTRERGGRAKRFVTVTPAGVRALARSRHALKELWRGLEPTLDEAP